MNTYDTIYYDMHWPVLQDYNLYLDAVYAAVHLLYIGGI